MILICLLFLSSLIRTGQATPSDLEGAYITDLTDAKDAGEYHQNHFLQLSRAAVASFCQWLFLKDFYKYNWKIHLNVLAFRNQEEDYETKKIYFRKEMYSKYNSARYKISQVMVPCYGQHRPLRTDWQTDDYNQAVFVATVRYLNIVYVFRKEYIKTHKVFVIHERIKLSEEQKNFPDLQIPDQMYKMNEILNSVKTINYDQREVEKIFVREIIINYEQITDPLEDLNEGMRVTICSSIFFEKIFRNEGSVFDHDGMLSFYVPMIQMTLTFQQHFSQIGRKKFMYQCMGNRAPFYISAGRRSNSIFVYKIVEQAFGFVIPTYFIENFDFINLRPTDPTDLAINVSP